MITTESRATAPHGHRSNDGLLDTLGDAVSHTALAAETAAKGVAQELGAEARQAAQLGGDAVRRFSTQASEFTQRSLDAVRDQTGVWRDGTVAHIREHPVRSVLVAVGAGVSLALLLRALSR